MLDDVDVAEVETVVLAVVETTVLIVLVDVVLVVEEVETGYRVEVICLMEDVLVELESSRVVVATAVGVLGVNVDVVLSNVPTKVASEDGIIMESVSVKIFPGWKLAILTGGGVETEVEVEPLETVKVDETCSVDGGTTILWEAVLSLLVLVLMVVEVIEAVDVVVVEVIEAVDMGLVEVIEAVDMVLVVDLGIEIEIEVGDKVVVSLLYDEEEEEIEELEVVVVDTMEVVGANVEVTLVLEDKEITVVVEDITRDDREVDVTLLEVEEELEEEVEEEVEELSFKRASIFSI